MGEQIVRMRAAAIEATARKIGMEADEIAALTEAMANLPEADRPAHQIMVMEATTRMLHEIAAMLTRAIVPDDDDA